LSEAKLQITRSQITNLFHLFVRRVLAATAAELFEFQPFGCRFAVFRFRVIALFAITALHRNDFSGHFNNSCCQLSSVSFRLPASN
jgi:hypothetical protein